MSAKKAVNRFVLDASAVLGAMRRERGADFVTQHGRGSLISSVNLAEVLSHPDIRHASTERVATWFRMMQIKEVPFDGRHARTLAEIYPLTLGSSVGFADRACLALAKQERLTALTGDRDWLKYEIGVEVQLFRGAQ